MKIGHALAAVFGVTETAVGITVVEVIHPKIVEPHKGSVPTKIEIPAYNVRKVTYRVKRCAHCIAGKCCGTAGIHFVNEIVEQPVVVKHVLAVLGGDGYLV